VTIAERIAATRKPKRAKAPPACIITVRMDRPMYERIKGVAHDQRASLNKLCVLTIEQAASELEQPAEGSEQ
jgi:predicted HicB family RNase H-like nuclease